MKLAGEIPAVADPNRQRFGAEYFTDLDAFDVVFDGLASHGCVGMRQASKPIGERLIGLILESVRVHRVKMESALTREPPEIRSIFRFVPWDVQRDTRRRSDELENNSAVFQFFIDITRLAGHGKASKARSTSSDAPRRNSDTKTLRLRPEVFNIDVLPM